jgi:phage FluMu protein Com
MKFYVKYRCPSCGDCQFTKIKSPFEDHIEEENFAGCKWMRCDQCNEVVVMPREAIIKE